MCVCVSVCLKRATDATVEKKHLRRCPKMLLSMR